MGFGLNAPAVLIKMGTAILGVDSELVLRGMNVISVQAERMGFEFQFPDLELALSELSNKR